VVVRAADQKTLELELRKDARNGKKTERNHEVKRTDGIPRRVFKGRRHLVTNSRKVGGTGTEGVRGKRGKGNWGKKR